MTMRPDEAALFDHVARALAHAETLRLGLTALEAEASGRALAGTLFYLIDELRGVEARISTMTHFDR